ncbi:uncharacterized protein LOC142889289 [Nelusetta ayraudi]|uniref:uncharacterized protein LOC142889289 n=1 Tax=Nelusetta ayraudi TaxID=303726 RepID=UPI003F6F24B0
MKKLFIILLQAALVEALSTITGYVGDPVVLPSGAAQSETLTEIEWSILNNNTVIASYYGGKKKVEWFYQFTGRLSLNSSSGDLTISNLSLGDALVYKVDRLNGKASKVQEVELIVRKHLQKPAITPIACPSNGGRYFALLQCSSPDVGVAFSWHVDAPVVTANNFTVGRDAFLLAIINSTQGNVQINCTARKDSDHASHSITTDCCRESPTPLTPLPPTTVKSQEKNSPSRCREPLAFLFGVFSTGGLLVLGIFLWSSFLKKKETVHISDVPSNGLLPLPVVEEGRR